MGSGSRSQVSRILKGGEIAEGISDYLPISGPLTMYSTILSHKYSRGYSGLKVYQFIELCVIQNAKLALS